MWAIIIGCSFDNRKHQPLAVVYVCFVKGPVKEISDPKLTEVVGHHKSGNSNNDVKMLHATQIKLKYFPQNVEQFFPNLERIFMYNTGIKSLVQSHLKPFPKLTYLLMQNNEIEELSSDVFQFNNRISELNFKRNKLRVIGSGVLKSLPNLAIVNFEENVCFSGKAEGKNEIKLLMQKLSSCYPDGETKITKHESCNKNVIQKLKQEIATLKIKTDQQEATIKSFKKELAKKSAEAKADNAKSCIQKLDDVTIALSEVNEALRRLKETPQSERVGKNMNLRLSQSDNEMFEKISSSSIGLVCDVAAWDRELSCSAVNLQILAENQMLRIVESKIKAAVDRSKINELKILNQHTLFLPFGIAQVFSNLRKLIVGNSKLTKISPESLKNLKNLKNLILASNRINIIAETDFAHLSQLENLDLSRNQIKKLDVGTFDTLVELTDLRLNGNQIEEIDNEVFAKNLKLRLLSLHDNHLEFIGAELLSTLGNLQHADFSGNDCIKTAHPKPSMRELKRTFVQDCAKPTKLCCRFEKIREQVRCIGVDFIQSIPNSMLNAVKSYDDCIREESGIDARVMSEPTNLKEVEDVTIFEVTGGDVRYLPNNLGQYFFQLSKLIVTDSKLLELRKDDLTGLYFLIFLQVSGNELKSLEPGLFDYISKLQHLDISNNKIKELPLKIFDHLNQLKVLKASRNHLVKLEPNLFPKKNSLEEIYFDANKLLDINAKIFTNLEKTKIIDFKENPCIGLRYPDETNFLGLMQKAIYCIAI